MMIPFIVGHHKEFDNFNVFMHHHKIKALDIKEGDIVKIHSRANRSVFVRVLRCAVNAPTSNVFMSRSVRLNLNCSLGQIVRIERGQNLPKAESVKIAPIADTIECLTGDFAAIFAQRQKLEFNDFPMHEGMVIPVRALGRIIEFIVTSCAPAEAVVVDHISKLHCDGRPPARTRNYRPFDVPCYDTVAGMNDLIYSLRSDLELPVVHPQIYEAMGLKSHAGILITAPEGCGKTFLWKAIRNEMSVHCRYIPGLELGTKPAGDTGQILKKYTDKAIKKAPAIVFFDDIDLIAREHVFEGGVVDRRLCWAVMASVDRLIATKGVVVIASARNENDICKELLIPNRFSRKLTISKPDAAQRREIIRVLTLNIPLGPNLTLDRLCVLLKGETGAELNFAIQRMFTEKSLAAVAAALEAGEKTVSVDMLNAITLDSFENEAEVEEPEEPPKEEAAPGQGGWNGQPFPNQSETPTDPFAATSKGTHNMLFGTQEMNLPREPAGHANPFALQPPGDRQGMALPSSPDGNDWARSKKSKKKKRKTDRPDAVDPFSLSSG